jgi:hypothetical protein
MRKLFFVLFILSANLLNAQETSYNYSGFIQLVDESKIPYQLKFAVKNERILGYSISDPFGLDETKSTIVGVVDSGVFLINEVDIMSSKAVVLDSEFCLLQMNLQLVTEGGVRYLKGEFNGFYTDSVPCASGEVLLVDSLSFVKSIIAEQALKEKEKKKELSVRTLSVESGLSFQTSKNSITLLLWDNGIVDGDVVSVFSNGELVLLDYKVKRRKKKLELSLQDGLNSISVKAVGVGLYAPNTTRIQIVGVGKKYEAVTYLRQGEQADIKIKRIPN